MKKIGFFGGCFNPVTNAHINLIKETIKKNNLNKVYFVPMGDYYHKKDLIPLEERIKMLKIAFKDDEHLDILNISNLEKETTAIDTFHKIDKLFQNDDRFFIMGSDNYKNIKTWKNADDLINNYQYIILDREEEKARKISSTKVREKIKHNESVTELVLPEIFDYIIQKNFYK